MGHGNSHAPRGYFKGEDVDAKQNRELMEELLELERWMYEEWETALGDREDPFGILAALRGALGDSGNKAALAYELRRRGYDVSPTATVAGVADPVDLEGVTAALDVSQRASVSPGAVERVLEGWGIGARAVVQVPMKGSGYRTLVAEYVAENRIRWVDPLTGSSRVDPRISSNIAYGRNATVLRVDNAGVTRGIMGEVASPEYAAGVERYRDLRRVLG